MALSDIIELPEFEAALGKGMKALRQMAHYEPEDAIQERMKEMGSAKSSSPNPNIGN